MWTYSCKALIVLTSSAWCGAAVVILKVCCGVTQDRAPRNRFNLFTAHPFVNSENRRVEEKTLKICLQGDFK